MTIVNAAPIWEVRLPAVSRGPGRLQRELLVLLADDNERDHWWFAGVRRKPDEWTTTHLCSAYNRAHPEWWWDETVERQVRRSLDALHRVGLVEKRVIEHGVYNRVGSVALWRRTT